MTSVDRSTPGGNGTGAGGGGGGGGAGDRAGRGPGDRSGGGRAGRPGTPGWGDEPGRSAVPPARFRSYYGRPIIKKPGDISETLQFNFGTTF